MDSLCSRAGPVNPFIKAIYTMIWTRAQGAPYSLEEEMNGSLALLMSLPPTRSVALGQIVVRMILASMYYRGGLIGSIPALLLPLASYLAMYPGLLRNPTM